MRIGRANSQEWLRLSQAAAALGVSPSTLRRWSDAGEPACYRSRGGHRRFRRADIEMLLRVQTDDAAAIGQASPAAGSPGDAGHLRSVSPALTLQAYVAAEDLVPRRRTALSVVQAPDEDSGPSPGDAGRLVDAALRLTRRAFDLSSCVVYTVACGEATAIASAPPSPAPDRWRLDEFPQARAAVAGRSVSTVHAGGGGLTSEVAARFLAGRGLSGLVLAPLVYHDDVVGLLEIGDGPERAPDLEEWLGVVTDVLARLLGDPFAIADLEQRQREMNKVIEVGLEDGTGRSAGEALRAAAECLAELTGASVVDLFTLEHDDTLRALVRLEGGRIDPGRAGAAVPLERHPCSRRAVESAEIVSVTTLDDPALDEEARRSLEKWGYQARLSVPLLSSGHVIGLVELSDHAPRDLGTRLGLVRAVCATATRALESAAQMERSERHDRILDELVELGRLGTHPSDIEHLQREIAQRLRAAMDSASCDIFRTTDDGLRCVASVDRSGFDERPVGDLLELGKYPTLADAINSHQVLVVASPDDPRLSESERRTYRDNGNASEVCVPLIANEELLGFIDIYDTRERDYTKSLGFLESTGHTLASAINNAVLVDKLQRRNAALAELVEIGESVSGAGGLDALVRTVGPRVVEVVGSAGCQVFAVRDDRLHCLLTYEDGVYEDDYVGLPLDLDKFPSTREALESRETLVIESPDDPRLTDYERALYDEAGSHSEICVPLVVGERIVGVLDVYDRKSRDYSEHRDFLVNVGQIVAGAFEQAALFDRLEATNRTLSLLVDSGLEFGATLQLDEVLHSVARRLCAAADAPGCDIYTLDGEMLRCVACIDHGESDQTYVGTSYELSDLSLSREAWTTREAIVVPDVARDGRMSAYERNEELSWGNLSKIELPLISRGEIIGLAGIFDDHPRTFDQLDLLQSLAQGAANALANATLYDRMDRAAERLALVNDVSFELSSSLQLDEVLTSAARRLCAVAGVDACDIYTLHDGNRLRNVVSIAGGQVDLSWQGREFALSEWAAPQEAVSTRQPILIGSLDDSRLLREERALMEEFGVTGELAVPLISKDSVIGVLELLETTGPCVLSQAQVETIFAASRVAALAIDNASLYEDIKRLHLSNLKTLSSALNAKDYYTLGHAARVAAYMVLLGRELGWPADLLRHVEEAAYLHDVGKIGVSDRVLLKPSALNPREWGLMRQHPIFSADIIHPLFDEQLVAGVRHHHEAYDGGGYPDGLAGDHIPELARAMCVVDSYDAMSFRRPYRRARSYAECLTELQRCSGSQFDPGMVAAFLAVLDRISQGRSFAAETARKAAALIDPEAHALLRTREDERRPEYAAISAALLAVCAANPPTRYISTHVRVGKKTVIVCDSGEPAPNKPHVGDETLTDDEFMDVFEGRSADVTVLFVDQWGVWISGVAPLLDSGGNVVAVVAADIPAAEGLAHLEGLHGKVAQTFSSMLQTAAAQAGRTEIEAITDGLTGLYNHRYFHERLSEEIDRCAERDTGLALLFVDLDDFRAFNERRGHSAGDNALRTVARLIEESVRHVDLVSRFGGEEFAAVLLDVSEDGALEVAERIRAGIVATEFAPGGDPLSVSIGVAVCPGDATFRDELIDKADWAMYLAKRRGRNKVVAFASEHGAATPEQAASANVEHVVAMSELATARAAYLRRRRAAIRHLSLAVARDLGLGDEELREVAVVAGVAGEAALSGAAGRAELIVAVATAYQAMVVESPYRARVSEAESLGELLDCPALLYERDLAGAFERVLHG
jgi:diguanylate cyclase (GGDEF)-like protein/excisionase family DNA binding protein